MAPLVRNEVLQEAREGARNDGTGARDAMAIRKAVLATAKSRRIQVNSEVLSRAVAGDDVPRRRDVVVHLLTDDERIRRHQLPWAGEDGRILGAFEEAQSTAETVEAVEILRPRMRRRHGWQAFRGEELAAVEAPNVPKNLGHASHSCFSRGHVLPERLVVARSRCG